MYIYDLLWQTYNAFECATEKKKVYYMQTMKT